jgi:hypothetical protein
MLEIRIAMTAHVVFLLAACSSDSAPAPAPASTPPPVTTPDASVAPTCVAGTGTKHSASPTADETWTAVASPHVIDASFSIPAGRTVTLEPCAVVQMKGAVGMLVEGKLLALGTAAQPIRIERGEAATAWTTIEARAGAELRLSHVTVEGGGNPNGSRLTEVGAFDIRGDQESATQPLLFVDTVTVKGSQSLGLLLREGGGFAPGSTGLTVTGGAGYPISIWGRAAGTLPSGTYSGNAVDEIIIPALGGRDDIKENTTLAARGVAYRIGGPTGGKAFNVDGPLLTIEAGAKLRFEKEARLEVASGALSAIGTADKPIVFESAAATPAPGDWVGIVIRGTPDPRNAIKFAKISHAGGPSQVSSYDCPSPANSSFANEGAILFIGGQPAPGVVANTTIENSAGDGIVSGWTGSPVDLLATNTFTNVARCQQTFPKPATGTCPDPAPCPK